MRHETRHSRPRPEHFAFTLVDLLVVILVVAALSALAILCPLVYRICGGTASVTKCQNRIGILGVGAVAYRNDNGRYPGQDDWGKSQLDSKALTGSQLLARALFTDPAGTGFPASNYAQYEPGSILATLAGKPDTITDTRPRSEAMAICYYPARLGVPGLAQFVADDNAPYTTPDHVASTFTSVITSVPGTPAKAGQFLLIAPGRDRKYFSDDDLSNFAGQ
ncbi:MAG: hypothetical protein NTV86_10650 [Planctomycetota bacterium]|nr:hypothetical protein [Planctomycetota bacterium]